MSTVAPLPNASEDTSVTGAAPLVWRFHPLVWGLLVGVVAAVAFGYWEAVSNLLGKWESEEYSHAPLIPFISLGLVYLIKDRIEVERFGGSWLGVLAAAAGAFGLVMGELSTVFTVTHYAMVLSAIGLVLALGGWSGWRHYWVPTVFLFFMVPLPPFLFNNLSQQLQLVSSEIGVAVIRLFGVSVFLEGNVIDLGSYKLQVVEACSGLRYLFPLMSFGFLAAYLFQAPLWQRAIIFLSTMPITVLMNSFRIGVIGVTVDIWGQEMAEGFLHDFEGWVIFMACVGVLICEMLVLMKLSGDTRPLAAVFGIELPAPTPKGASFRTRDVPASFLAASALLGAAALGAATITQREPVIPERRVFAEFPLEIEGWQGRSSTLEQVYLDALRLTDYFVGDYRSPTGDYVNFYSAYYEQQRSGESAHSPRSCLPGAGWVISSLTQRPIEGATVAGLPLVVNRVQIQQGDQRSLVYYWFQQRGRVITNEYLVKWYLFQDSLLRGRSDGALVRLVTAIPPGQSWESGDARLEAFARAVDGPLEAYIPN